MRRIIIAALCQPLAANRRAGSSCRLGVEMEGCGSYLAANSTFLRFDAAAGGEFLPDREIFEIQHSHLAGLPNQAAAATRLGVDQADRGERDGKRDEDIKQIAGRSRKASQRAARRQTG